MGEEHRMILEMVRQRTITPEEGVQLLQALVPFVTETASSQVPEGGPKWRPGAGVRRSGTGLTGEAALQDDASRPGETEGKWSFRWGNLSARLSEVFEAALEKVRGIDLELGDFQWGAIRPVEEVFVGEMDGKQLTVVLPHGSIALSGWDDPGYRIEIKGYVKEEAEAEALRHLRKHVHFRKGEQMVLELEKHRRYRVEVRACVPRAWLEELTVVAYNGLIQLSNLDVDRMVLHSHNGAISLHQVVGQELEATAGNGKLEMVDCHCPQASLLSINGPMDVAAVLGDATCRTVNGPMHVQLQAPAGGQLFLRSTNGSIRLGVPENVSIEGELTGAFGKVYNTLPNIDVQGEVKEWLNYSYVFRTSGTEECHVRLTGNCTNGSVYVAHSSADSKGESSDG